MFEFGNRALVFCCVNLPHATKITKKGWGFILKCCIKIAGTDHSCTVNECFWYRSKNDIPKQKASPSLWTCFYLEESSWMEGGMSIAEYFPSFPSSRKTWNFPVKLIQDRQKKVPLHSISCKSRFHIVWKVTSQIHLTAIIHENWWWGEEIRVVNCPWEVARDLGMSLGRVKFGEGTEFSRDVMP